MASRNELKVHIQGAIYHAYNRGVARQRIFDDSFDYQRFKIQLGQAAARESDITILAFTLMPNHFHLLLAQTDDYAMSRFMRRLITGYVMYYNRRNRRVGPLFQGKYKAAQTVGPAAVMEASRYIHLNPHRAGLDWKQYQHSSLRDYVDPVQAHEFVDPGPVLELFDEPGDYIRYLELRPPA